MTTQDKLAAALYNAEYFANILVQYAAGKAAHEIDGEKAVVVPVDAIYMLEAYLNDIRAALKAHEAEDSGWQDISTAPRGSQHGYILGINMNGKPPHSVYVMRDTFIPSEEFTHAAPGACWRGMYAEWPCYPTHWQPLPQPPKGKE